MHGVKALPAASITARPTRQFDDQLPPYRTHACPVDSVAVCRRRSALLNGNRLRRMHITAIAVLLRWPMRCHPRRRAHQGGSTQEIE